MKCIIKIDLDITTQLLELQSEIYNHKDMPQTVKDLLEIRLNQILGKEYDIAGLLKKYNWL